MFKKSRVFAHHVPSIPKKYGFLSKTDRNLGWKAFFDFQSKSLLDSIQAGFFSILFCWEKPLSFHQVKYSKRPPLAINPREAV